MDSIKKFRDFIKSRFFIILLVGTIFSYASFNLFMIMDGSQEKYFTYPESTYQLLEEQAQTIISQQNSIPNFERSDTVISAYSEEGMIARVYINNSSTHATVRRSIKTEVGQIFGYQVAFFLISLLFTVATIVFVYFGLFFVFWIIYWFKKIRVKLKKK